MKRWSYLSLVMFLAVSAACGGGGTTADSSEVATGGPEPAVMCPSGETPVVAAYGLDNGEFRWAACAPGAGLYAVRSASADTVMVQTWSNSNGSMVYLAFDAGTGAALWTGDEARFLAESASAIGVAIEAPGAVDGVRLSGGQDSPLVAVDAATGAELWTRNGRLVYDNVWAIGDGAVFAVEPRDTGPVLVGYELRSGDTRWEAAMDRHDGYMSPWFVSGQRLLVLWYNLQVRSTVDGTVLWKTTYAIPTAGFPRMIGGVTNADTVFVSFTGQTAGGD